MSISSDILVAASGGVLATSAVATAKFLRDVAEVTKENKHAIHGHPEHDDWAGLVEIARQNQQRIEQHEDRLANHADRLEKVEDTD